MALLHMFAPCSAEQVCDAATLLLERVCNGLHHVPPQGEIGVSGLTSWLSLFQERHPESCSLLSFASMSSGAWRWHVFSSKDRCDTIQLPESDRAPRALVFLCKNQACRYLKFSLASLKATRHQRAIHLDSTDKS